MNFRKAFSAIIPWVAACVVGYIVGYSGARLGRTIQEAKASNRSPPAQIEYDEEVRDLELQNWMFPGSVDPFDRMALGLLEDDDEELE